MQDLNNSITRYVKNNYLDGSRQDGFDLFLGNYVVRAPKAGKYVSPFHAEKALRVRVVRIRTWEMFKDVLRSFNFCVLIGPSYSDFRFYHAPPESHFPQRLWYHLKLRLSFSGFVLVFSDCIWTSIHCPEWGRVCTVAQACTCSIQVYRASRVRNSKATC